MSNENVDVQKLIAENTALKKAVDSLNLKIAELQKSSGLQSVSQPNIAQQTVLPPIPEEQTPLAETVSTTNIISITNSNIDQYATTILGVTDAPNQINLIVKDKNGSLVSDVVCIIKNESNLPIRASKSNPFGQVLFSSPLANGTYIIELTKDNLTFPAIKVILDGKVLKSFEIKAI